MSDGDDDEEAHFTVELPVHTFDDFHKLEEQLDSSSAKRRSLVSDGYLFEFEKCITLHFNNLLIPFIINVEEDLSKAGGSY